MSPADFRRRWSAAKAFTLAAPVAISVAATLVLSAAVLLVAPPLSLAAAGDLAVTMDRSLTQTNEMPALTVSGDAVRSLQATDTIAVLIAGPATLAQLSQPAPALPQAGSFSVAAGSLPSVAQVGVSQLHLPVPLAGLPALPGAYRVTVEVRSGTALTASGATWMGRVVVRSDPLDLAFVWRAALGIHQGPDGSFFDTTLEQACTPAGTASSGATASGDLPALLSLAGSFPDWHFSLGVEPVLLTQLRDMAGGYTRTDPSGANVQVDPGAPETKNAAAVLTDLGALSGNDSVEIAVSPYAGPDLGLLATQGWRDGFAQVQLGKQEVVETMGLGSPPSGAWSPALDLTTGSLRDYGEASIDHVLVDAAVAADLTEPVAKGTVAVRAHDDQNDRVTLVLADSGLRRLMVSPWDPALLFAGIAAVLASGDVQDALVLSPAPDFALPPAEYLDAIGEELQNDSWLRTQTMSGLLRAHPPGTRPVLLSRDPAPLTGYIAQTIFSAIQTAHATVDDLATIADPANLPLESARRSLYLAESRFWSRPGVSPEEASAGLGYAVQAGQVAKDELDAVTLGANRHATILGHKGEVELVATNHAQSAVTVELRLAGDGLSFPQGNTVKVKLEPGGNGISVPVVGNTSSRELTAALIAGSTVLDKTTASLRFVTLADILPWAGLGVFVIVVAVLVALFARKTKTRKAG